MSYAKVLYYADIVEVTSYERHPAVRRIRSTVAARPEIGAGESLLVSDRGNAEATSKPPKIRSEGDARRTVLAFRRLCITNLATFGNPVWASFTYGANMCDVDQSRKDWIAFARRATVQFGKGFRYIAVTEFQERGAVHFHAFLWGLPESVVAEDRSTRLVARLWGKGFCDLLITDGSPKMATYMSKYAGKTFMDARLAGRRCYITSRNISRPIVDKGAVLGMYFHGDLPGVPDLSTGVVLHESEYDTQYMGRAHYKKYKLLKAICPK